jgi:hypothetical protein
MSKIGGIKLFPFTSAQTYDVPITLASGGVFVMPSGNYILMPGTNTRIQYMDPIALQWRSYAGGLQGGEYMSSDGCNNRLINITGTITVAVTAAGSGATNGIGAAATGVTIAIAASPVGLTSANATAFAIVGGSVAAPSPVTPTAQPGSGFVTAPLVLIDPPPPGGIQATAYATLNATGGVASITMDNVGAGYTTSPQFYLIPQPAVYQGAPIAGVGPDMYPAPGSVHPSMLPQGSVFQPNQSALTGALFTLNALTGSGTLTGIGMLNWGSGYATTAPAVTITGAGAATATASLGPAPAVDRSYLQSRVG